MGMNIPNPMDKGAPPAPDYKGAVTAQTLANRPNQSTPWARSTWTSGASAQPGSRSIMDVLNGRPGTPGTPGGRDTQGIELAGPLAGLNSNLESQAAGAWASPLDSGADARQHAEDAIYGRAASRLDPMWAQRDHDLSATLANQGIDPSSAAYGKALDNQGRSRNDAYTSAMMEAIMGGGTEGQRTQQMDLQRRMAPLSAMGGLQSLSGMPTPGAAGNSLQAAALQGQYGLDKNKSDREFWNDMVQGGMQVAGAAGLFSDERLKEDIQRYAEEILPGVPVASFRYRWEPVGTRHLGVIAQDLEAKHPELVTYRDGYRCVPARFLLT